MIPRYAKILNMANQLGLKRRKWTPIVCHCYIYVYIYIYAIYIDVDIHRYRYMYRYIDR